MPLGVISCQHCLPAGVQDVDGLGTRQIATTNGLIADVPQLLLTAAHALQAVL